MDCNIVKKDLKKNVCTSLQCMYVSLQCTSLCCKQCQDTEITSKNEIFRSDNIFKNTENLVTIEIKEFSFLGDHKKKLHSVIIYSPTSYKLMVIQGTKVCQAPMKKIKQHESGHIIH